MNKLILILAFTCLNNLIHCEDTDTIDEIQKQSDFKFIKETIDCLISGQSLDKPEWSKSIILDKSIKTTFTHCLWKSSNVHGLDASFYLNQVDTLFKCLNKNRPKGALSGKSYFKNIMDLFYVMGECYNPNLCDCDGFAAFSNKLKDCQISCYNYYDV